MSNGGCGVGGECDEGRNGNGEQEGEEKGCVKMTMKCKYMEESRKNINLSLLHHITKATDCTGGSGGGYLCASCHTSLFQSVQQT